MFQKRTFAALLTAGALFLTGCGSATPQNRGSSKDQLRIVCTIFPEYDWTKQILGSHIDEVDLHYVLDSGADLHSFQPTMEDMMMIGDCDLFMYIGGESDEWTADAIAESVNPQMQTVALLDALGDAAVTEEIREGMQADEEEAEEEGEEEAPEYDEHVWLSVRNAKTLCGVITEKLCQLDSKNAADYRENLAAYTQKLDALDQQFQALADGAQQKTLLFGDRFPFRYFTEDYGLDYYAAFVGCSAETEASFETVVFLANKLDELGLDTVYTIESSDGSIARTIIENTKDKNQQIAVLNSIQSVTADQVKSGTTYLSLMQQNYDVLKAHLK